MISSLRAKLNTIYRSTFVRSTVWYTAGALAIKVLAFAMVPVYTLLLTPEQFGTVALFMTWVGLFTIGFSLYVYVVPVRARADYDDERFQQFVSSITVLGILASIVLTVLLALLPETFFSSFFGLPKLLIVAAAASIPFAIPARMILSFWQAETMAAPYSRLSVLQEILIAIFSVLFIVLPSAADPSFDRALGRIAAVLLIRSALGLFYLPRFISKKFFNREYWWYALSYALPIVPHALAETVLANFDRVQIAQFYSQREVGIYSVAYQFGSIVALVAAAAAASWSPWFYRQMTDKKIDLVRHRTQRYILAFAAFTVAAIIVGPLIVRFLTPSRYWEAMPVVPIVMAAGFFLFLHYFFLFIETHQRKTWYTSVATLSAAGLNIALNAYLLPRTNYTIAGWTSVIAYGFLFVIHAVVVRLVLKSDRVNNLRLMLALGIMVCFIAWFMYRITL